MRRVCSQGIAMTPTTLSLEVSTRLESMTQSERLVFLDRLCELWCTDCGSNQGYMCECLPVLIKSQES